MYYLAQQNRAAAQKRKAEAEGAKPKPAKKIKTTREEIVAKAEAAGTTHMVDDFPRCRPEAQWDTERPPGLIHAPALLNPTETQTARDQMDAFERDCVQRFGARNPNSANHNFLHYKRRGPRLCDEAQVFDTPSEAVDTNPAGFRQIKFDGKAAVAMPQWMISLVDGAKAKLLALHAEDPAKAEALGLTPELHEKLRVFEANTCAAHLLRPGGGVGAHFDDARRPGGGFVFMITVTRPRQPYTKVTFTHEKTRRETKDITYPDLGSKGAKRTFQFDQPMTGKKFQVTTPDGTCTIFTDAAYDAWRHSSIGTMRQEDLVFSLTFRDFAPPGDAAKYKQGKEIRTQTASRVARERWFGLRVD